MSNFDRQKLGNKISTLLKKISKSIFEEYTDLYKLTAMTANEHISFYKQKEKVSMDGLFDLWKKLSKQANDFDDVDWAENWHNWHKNYHIFEKHKMEARYLIQSFLTHVLEELLRRVLEKHEEYRKLVSEKVKSSANNDNISKLIKTEVKRIVKQELAKQNKTKK